MRERRRHNTILDGLSRDFPPIENHETYVVVKDLLAEVGPHLEKLDTPEVKLPSRRWMNAMRRRIDEWERDHPD